MIGGSPRFRIAASAARFPVRISVGSMLIGDSLASSSESGYNVERWTVFRRFRKLTMRERMGLQRMKDMAESKGEYDVGQSCLNGHEINPYAIQSPEFNANFCKQCGEPTITACPKCKKPIRGKYTPSYGIQPWDIPSYCHECGAAYPWTERRAAALAEAIDELDQLPEGDREKLKQSIPDVLKDTLNTQTAASRFVKAIGKAGQVGGKLLTDVLTSVATEAALKLSGLKP